MDNKWIQSECIYFNECKVKLNCRFKGEHVTCSKSVALPPNTPTAPASPPLRSTCGVAGAIALPGQSLPAGLGKHDESTV